MAAAPAQKKRTFSDVLAGYANKKLNTSEDSSQELLTGDQRKAIFDQLGGVVEESSGSKLFDKTSLRQMGAFMDRMEKFYNNLENDSNLAKVMYPDPQVWYQESYLYMYDELALLEIIRYFGAGRTQYDKEIVFKSMTAKLIKTQETVRTVLRNEGFLTRYLEQHKYELNDLAEILNQSYKFSERPQPLVGIKRSLQRMVLEMAYACLQLLQQLDIAIHDSAQPVYDKKKYYEALVLQMRYSDEDLFEFLASDDYTTLVQLITKVIFQFQAHPMMPLFQHVKREYMTDWLVMTLRDYDRKGAEDNFYQAGKAGIYEKEKRLSLPSELLENMRQREKLDDDSVIEGEMAALRSLSEDDFYNLLLKFYGLFKDDNQLGKHMPLSVQNMASSGNLAWEKQNMAAQAAHKLKMSEKSLKKEKKSIFQSFFSEIKKANNVFSSVRKKMESKKQQAEQAPPSPKKEDPPPPPPPPEVKLNNTGKPLEACFPIPKRDVPNLVAGQSQDYSFNNSDAEAFITPLEQEFLVNFFNVEKTANQPQINPAYLRYTKALEVIMESYKEHIQHIEKHMTIRGKSEGFKEQVLYLKVRNDLIVTLGITKMGQSSNIDNLPESQTSYFRVFVQGPLMKQLGKLKVPSVFKKFQINDKGFLFKEITIPALEASKDFKVVPILAMISVVESLPHDQFEQLHQDDEFGFILSLKKCAQVLNIGTE